MTDEETLANITAEEWDAFGYLFAQMLDRTHWWERYKRRWLRTAIRLCRERAQSD